MKQLNEINKTIKKDIIVENLMISNGVYLLVSHPKVGKSMFAQQLAFSLTTGEDFLGLKVKPSHVLYVTTEGDLNQLDMRYNLMNLHPVIDKLHIVDHDDTPDFYIRDIECDIHQLASDGQKLFVIMDMLKDIKFDKIYSSPLERAYSTAKIIDADKIQEKSQSIRHRCHRRGSRAVGGHHALWHLLLRTEPHMAGADS